MPMPPYFPFRSYIVIAHPYAYCAIKTKKPRGGHKAGSSMKVAFAVFALFLAAKAHAQTPQTALLLNPRRKA